MNQSEFYAAWVAALRSGEYRQGGGALRVDNDFCCLGVACDISSMHNEWGGEWAFDGKAPAHFLIDGERDSGTFPARLQELLEMTAAGDFDIPGGGNFEPPLARHLTQRTALTELNDEGFTFSQLADVIEYFFAPKSV